MLRTVLFLFTALPAARAQDAPSIYAPLVEGDLAEKVDSWMTRAEAFGLHGALLVQHDGQLILRQGYGLADREQGREITARTRFDIGSLGKQFTAAAVAHLVEEGELGWETTLGELLPDVPGDKEAITVHQLLTHTAALPYQPPRGELLDAELVGTPGERFAYSNVGYALLGRIVESTSEATLEAVCAELFRRAGAAGIVASGHDVGWEDEAHGYVDGFDWGVPSRLRLEGLKGAGGFACTVGELFAWIEALEAGRVLAPEIVERMFTNHSGGPNGYGYGWFVLQTMRGTPLVRHMGDYNGFNSELRRYRGEERTIVFLSNTFERGRSMREAVVNRVALILAGRDVAQPPAVVAALDEERMLVRGSYVTPQGTRFEVRSEGTGLEIVAFDQAGVDVLYGVKEAVERAAIVAEAERRTRSLLQALREDDRAAIEALCNPAWVGAYRDLSEAWGGLVERLGKVGNVELVATAIEDLQTQDARSVLRASGPGGEALARVTWTRRGALGSDFDAELPSRTFLPTGTREYAAFDLFTGTGVHAEFESAEGAPQTVALRVGELLVQAERLEATAR